MGLVQDSQSVDSVHGVMGKPKIKKKKENLSTAPSKNPIFENETHNSIFFYKLKKGRLLVIISFDVRFWKSTYEAPELLRNHRFALAIPLIFKSNSFDTSVPCTLDALPSFLRFVPVQHLHLRKCPPWDRFHLFSFFFSFGMFETLFVVGGASCLRTPLKLSIPKLSWRDSILNETILFLITCIVNYLGLGCFSKHGTIFEMIYYYAIILFLSISQPHISSLSLFFSFDTV